jgi:hypothetical protein
MKHELLSLHTLSKIRMILGHRHENFKCHKYQEGSLKRQNGPVSRTEKRANLPATFGLFCSNYTLSPSLIVRA